MAEVSLLKVMIKRMTDRGDPCGIPFWRGG